MYSTNHLARLALSASTAALAVGFAAPASAQSNTQQTEAERVNTAVDCSTVTDPPQHATCIQTRGQNALPASGAPREGTIVVTGSRIPRPNFDTIEPSVVVNSAQLEARGFDTAAEALNELPTFGVPGNSPVGAAQQGAFGTGQNFVNFLGLGDQRTLVLVNGRRFISSNTSGLFGATSPGEQVDLSQINTKLIDHIDTIAIGGAPIYGSDAIAGTINVILKHDYQGFDIDGQRSVSDHSDAPNWRVRLLAGHNFLDSRANVTISGEYNRGKGFVWNSRAALAAHRFYDSCPPGSQFNQCLYANLRQPVFGGESGTPLVTDYYILTPDQWAQLGAAGFSAGVQNSAGQDLMFAPGGGLIPINYGTTPGGPDNALNTFNVIGGNGFDVYNTQQALSDTKRYNANILAHVDVTDNIRLFAEGWYAYSASTQLQNQPVYNCFCFGIPAGQPAGNIILSVNNPFLTADERSIILDNIANNPFSDQNSGVPNQDYFYMTRANTDLYNARSTYRDSLYRIVGGLNGHFGLWGHQWNWEVVANYGRSHTRGSELQVNEQNFQNALNAVRDSSGNIVCAPYTNSPFPTLNSTCSPLNLFGHGLSSQAALDYILSPAGGSTVNTQRVFTADVTGPLFKLPGGDFSIALGAETRHETSDFEPSAFYRGGPDPDPTVDSNGDGDPTNDFVSFYQGVPIQPVKGSFTTKELFGEADADIVGPSNNVPGIYRLDAQLAVRYVNHSVAGNAVTWTAGSRYAPIKDIAFRGNFTHAIRAPSIQETTIPTSTFYNGATDPCDIDQLTVGPDPATRAKNCAASGPLGVPAGYEQNAGVTFLQGVRGNPNLRNETSNAYSIGGVLSPRFIPHFSLTADYVNVKLKNAIANFSATQVLNACYDATDFPSNFYCSLIRRNPAPGAQLGQLQFVNTSFFNANELHYRGIVASFDYWIGTPFLGAGSKVSVNGQYQRLLQLTSRASDESSNTHNQGTLGYPKHSAVLNINYQNKWLNLYTDFNYTGAVNQGIDEPDGYREHQRLSPVIFTNVGFKIEAPHGLRIFMDVDNVFNRGVPYPVPAFGGSVTYFPGVLGRYYRIGAGYHF